MRKAAALTLALAAALCAEEAELEGNWVWRRVAVPGADGKAPEPEPWVPSTAGNRKAREFSLARQLAETAGVGAVALGGFSPREDHEVGLVFSVPEAHRGRRNVELVFDQIDTFAEVYVDGKLVLEASNAFRRWVVPLPPSDSPERQLLVRLTPTREEAARREAALPRAAIGGERVLARRPQLGFGGPVSPAVLDLSVSYPRIRSWDGATVREASVVASARPVLREEGGSVRCASADLRLEMEVDSELSGEAFLSVSCQGTSAESKVLLKPGRNRLALPFTLREPPLWWPAGMGGQNMLSAGWELRMGDRRLTGSEAFGVRDLRLVRETDERGETFRLTANGRPFFARGAHLLPANALHPTRDDLSALVLAREAGLNLVRIWAGGGYASDELIRQCDAWGILVWQDLPFLDGVYPLEGVLLENVRSEVAENVRRLRGHPSLALWCGITGAAEGWHDHGWADRLGSPRAVSEERSRQREFFGKTLPGWINELDPGRAYLDNSPRLGWRREPSYRTGDLWYRGLEEGAESLETAQTRVGRFVSGYGMASLPSPAVIRTWSASPGGKPASAEAFWRTTGSAPESLSHRLGQEGLRPEGEASRAFASRWLQAEAVRVMASAHRADPGCAGSLAWHLNDCWPTASASLVDFAGAPKPAYYAMRQALATESVRLWFQGDSVHAQSVGKANGVLLRLLGADGRAVGESKGEGDAPAALGMSAGRACYALAESGPHRVIRPLPPAYRGTDARMAKASFRTSLRRDPANAFGISELTVEADTVVIGLCLEPLLPGARAMDGLVDLLPGERHVFRVKLGEPRDWRASLRPMTWHDLGVVPSELAPEPTER